jgi:hypothetical protein
MLLRYEKCNNIQSVLRLYIKFDVLFVESTVCRGIDCMESRYE